MEKKGALELSINTIVIVVIGITLLTLGLVFVRGIFGQLDTLSRDTFGTAQAQIGRLGQGDARLITPSIVTVNQGKTTQQNLVIGNDGEVGEFTVTLQRSSSSILPSEIGARMVLVTGAVNNNQHEFRLKSGESLTIPLVIAATSDAPLTTGPNSIQYAIEVKKDGQPYENGAFIITVEKGAGLFG